MGMTEYGQNLALDCILGNATIPETLYLALTTAQPDEFDTGDLLDEPIDPSYERQAIMTGATYWSESESGIALFLEEVVFPVTTEPWNRIKYWVLCTEETAGNVIIWAQFESIYTLPAGQYLTIPTESLGISLAAPTTAVAL